MKVGIQKWYQITATGVFAICDGIYRTMVTGLARSLGFALFISLVVFSCVLRSWRLGLIALVPNGLPLLLTLGIMVLMGIDLKPTTVICFSISTGIPWLSRFTTVYGSGCWAHCCWGR